MTPWRWVWRGLRHYRASYAGVLAGSALGAMVLLGSLFAGDSVKETLRRSAEARVGQIEKVLAGGDRMFRAALADDLAGPSVSAAPVLLMQGTATAQASGRATGKVQVLGVDARFMDFAPAAAPTPQAPAAPPAAREFLVNEHLARSLGLAPGDILILRFPKPGLAPRDAPLAGEAEDLVTLRGTVRAVAGEHDFGGFSLQATQLPQATVLVPLARLQQETGQAGKANLLLLRGTPAMDDLQRDSLRRFKLEDYGLSLVRVPPAAATEVRTTRVFFDRPLGTAIQACFPDAQPVITYLANTIAANGKEIPYSMVTAAGSAAAPFVPQDPGGAVLNRWAADDLGAKAGDQVSVAYYAVGPDNRLAQRTARFRVAKVVPLEGLAADRAWMPEFPGLAAAEDTADWNPGLPLDLKRIRDKDEAYWDQYRGTPKMFLPLADGRRLFGNRWGEFTALRVPWATATPEEAGPILLERLRPADAGLVWRDLRAEALAAAASPVDFAGLLLGMSFFLMAAAVALTAMLFRFHLEQRNRESGLLAALGIPPGKVLRWRLAEGLCVVAAGSAAGTLLATLYTPALLRVLDTIWGETGGASSFLFHAAPATVAGGNCGFVALMMLAIWQVTRKQARQSASLRLEAGTEEVTRARGRRARWWALGLLAAGAAAMATAKAIGPQGAFFLAGFAFLSSGLAACRWNLWRLANRAPDDLTPRRLAQCNAARRPARTLVVTGSLACGVFLVVAVAAFRKHGGEEWKQRASGAGGFAFWVETTHAPPRASDSSGELADLGEQRHRFGEIVPLRVGAGDSADCFNLQSVARPRLLATRVARLAELGAFAIKSVAPGLPKDWRALQQGDTTRAFVDETTLLWVLKKKPGDRIVYQDEWGRDFPVEIAGTLADSVFQGSLVVDEEAFLRHFPSAEGPRVFLLDCATDTGEATKALQQALADRGAVVSTTAARLAAFHGVENTYIAIFHVLGGLGVVLGSAGLGLVTAQNLVQRRQEFAILHTCGIPESVTRQVVRREVARAITWGLAVGTVAALVAIAPNFAATRIAPTAAWVALLLGLIAANAWFWSWLGYRRQIRAALESRSEFL